MRGSSTPTLVQTCEKVRDLSASDLGAGDVDTSSIAHLSPLIPNFLRGWLRLNFALLIREQAVMIRHARAQMQGGKTGNLGNQPSLVCSGSKWEINGDAATNTITLKLTPRPSWTNPGTVTDDHFFMLPLDGSKPWQLRQPQPATASAAQF